MKKKLKKKSGAYDFLKAVKTIMRKKTDDNGDGPAPGKTPDPKSFNGDANQLERFLRQVSNKFALERKYYKLDLDKIRYTSQLLTDKAAKWYEAYHLQIDEKAADFKRGYHVPLDPSFAQWDRFEASLRASFGSSLTRDKALQEWEDLTHNEGVDTFLDEISRLMWTTGYADDVVEDKIRRSLNYELGKDWSKVVNKPKDLGQQMELLREMGHRNERWEATHKNRSNPKTAKASGKSKGKFQKKSEGKTDAKPVKEKKEKKKEGGWKDKSVELKGIPKKLLDERVETGVCLKCGKTGHSWYECWTKEPVTGRVASSYNKRSRKDSESKGDNKDTKKQKAIASAEKKEEKPVIAGSSIAGRIMEIPEDQEDLDVWEL
jgi:hypothetical protein